MTFIYEEYQPLQLTDMGHPFGYSATLHTHQGTFQPALSFH
jgi:hypothetical protein